MIAVSRSGKSFGALAAYLAAGRSGDEPDRVAWSAGRNLPTSEPKLAATFMRATAAQSDRVQKPVYHLAVSFDPGDPVDRTTMERVADRLLERLGLAEYQAIIVAHRDREHPHLHIMVNRVHPETGKAWERWRDQPMIQQVLREEERALGLREVPGRLAQLVEPEVSAPATRVIGARRREAEASVSPGGLTRDIQAYEQVIAFRRARAEAEMAVQAARARLDELGIAIERAEHASTAFDRALARVYRDPAAVRAAFNHMVTEQGIEQAVHDLRTAPERFGALRTITRSRIGGLLAAQDETNARVAARAAAEHGREAVETERAVWRLVAESRIRRLEDALAREFAAAYDEPQAARARFVQMTAEHGAAHAVQALREGPESFGALRTAADGRDHTAALMHVRLAADAALSIERARDEIGGRGAAMTPTDEQAAARAAVEQAQAHAQAARSDERRQPRREEVEWRLARAMHRLEPRDLERLHNLLTAPQWALVQQLKATVRDVMLGREEGREQ